MKYIFLDIDGVLNNGTGSFLHKDKVSMLSHIVKTTNAKIVLISSWKDGWFKDDSSLCSHHAKAINNTFAEFGITVHDKTEDNNSWKRGKGINDYLQEKPATQWIVLDDETFPDYNEYDIENHWIKTAFSVGLTEDLANIAIEYLLKTE